LRAIPDLFSVGSSGIAMLSNALPSPTVKVHTVCHTTPKNQILKVDEVAGDKAKRGSTWWNRARAKVSGSQHSSNYLTL
jgi:hypothetical protein